MSRKAALLSSLGVALVTVALTVLLDVRLALAALFAGIFVIVMLYIRMSESDDTKTTEIFPKGPSLPVIPQFKGRITDVHATMALPQRPLRGGTFLRFNLHFTNDSPQKAAIEAITVTVADAEDVVFEDKHPGMLSSGSELTLPTKAYERGDAALINMTAMFCNLEYDKVDKESLAVELTDSVVHQEHVIRQ